MAERAKLAERTREAMLGPAARLAEQCAAVKPAFEMPEFGSLKLFNPPNLDTIRPAKPQVSASEEVFGRISAELQRRNSEVAGTRKQVLLKITVPDGRVFIHDTLQADGGNMILTYWHDLESGEPHELSIGAAAFQIENVTIDVPPPKPRLME